MPGLCDIKLSASSASIKKKYRLIFKESVLYGASMQSVVNVICSQLLLKPIIITLSETKMEGL